RKTAFAERSRAPALQNIIETGEQMRNRFFRLVAHVRETERFAFDFAVARVDDQMMFAPQFASELQNVDAAVVFHASKRFRSEAFLSEKVKTGAAHPIVHECIRARMSTLHAENDDTVSTMSVTSGYLPRTEQISPSGFITPVEVSL